MSTIQGTSLLAQKKEPLVAVQGTNLWVLLKERLVFTVEATDMAR